MIGTYEMFENFWFTSNVIKNIVEYNIDDE